MPVTPEQQREVYERDKGMCVICGKSDILDAHHSFKKSEYHQPDKDGNWNLNLLCRSCHNRAHGGDPEINKRVKQLALKRYEGEHKERLLEIYKQRFGEGYGEK